MSCIDMNWKFVFYQGCLAVLQVGHLYIYAVQSTRFTIHRTSWQLCFTAYNTTALLPDNTLTNGNLIKTWILLYSTGTLPQVNELAKNAYSLDFILELTWFQLNGR